MGEAAPSQARRAAAAGTSPPPLLRLPFQILPTSLPPPGTDGRPWRLSWWRAGAGVLGRPSTLGPGGRCWAEGPSARCSETPSFGQAATLYMLKEIWLRVLFVYLGGGCQAPLFDLFFFKKAALWDDLWWAADRRRGGKLPAAAQMGPVREATAGPKEGSLRGGKPTHRGKAPGGRRAGLVFPL